MSLDSELFLNDSSWSLSDLHGNGNQLELGYCTGDVHVAGFALSDATQQNCIPTPRTICQSWEGNDTGGGGSDRQEE